MANARIVLAQGVIDGVNTVFATGVPYVPRSTAYVLNGRIHSLSLPRGPDNPFGYIELSPDSGTIQVDNPPDVDDVVQIFFWDRVVTPPPPITQLAGVVNAKGRLTGVAREDKPARLAGLVRSPRLVGVAREPEPMRLAGVVRSKRIVGTIKEDC
jgi:hypothetical protein